MDALFRENWIFIFYRIRLIISDCIKPGYTAKQRFFKWVAGHYIREVARLCCRRKILVAGLLMQTVAERQVRFQCAVLNIAGLFKAHEIRKAGGNKLSNHWNVLKSTLLRVTPTRLITRRDILDIGQHEGAGATTPGFAHRSRNGSSAAALQLWGGENSL